MPPSYEFPLLPKKGITRISVRISVGVGIAPGKKHALARSGRSDVYQDDRYQDKVRPSYFLVPMASIGLSAPATILNNHPVDKFIDITRGY